MSNPGETTKDNRALVWVNDATFHGWVCSRCEWNSPLPTLLGDPTAKLLTIGWRRESFASMCARTFKAACRPADQRLFRPAEKAG